MRMAMTNKILVKNSTPHRMCDERFQQSDKNFNRLVEVNNTGNSLRIERRAFLFARPLWQSIAHLTSRRTALDHLSSTWSRTISAPSGIECDYCLHPTFRECCAGTGDRSLLLGLGRRPGFRVDRDPLGGGSSYSWVWICRRRAGHGRMSCHQPDRLFRGCILDVPLRRPRRFNAGRSRRPSKPSRRAGCLRG
jgi:hypothetical protein